MSGGCEVCRGGVCVRGVARAQITVLSRVADDDFLLLASDGLWDVMSNQVRSLGRRAGRVRTRLERRAHTTLGSAHTRLLRGQGGLARRRLGRGLV